MLLCQQEAPTISYMIDLLEDHARRTSSRLHFEVVDIFTIIKNNDIVCHIQWCEITSKYTRKWFMLWLINLKGRTLFKLFWPSLVFYFTKMITKFKSDKEVTVIKLIETFWTRHKWRWKSNTHRLLNQSSHIYWWISWIEMIFICLVYSILVMSSWWLVRWTWILRVLQFQAQVYVVVWGALSYMFVTIICWSRVNWFWSHSKSTRGYIQ
jgi:hypothetical protein